MKPLNFCYNLCSKDPKLGRKCIIFEAFHKNRRALKLSYLKSQKKAPKTCEMFIKWYNFNNTKGKHRIWNSQNVMYNF